jgi:hypothetical protein
MSRCDRIIFCALVTAHAISCSSSAHVEAESARHSLFDADFALLYSQALEATRELYPNIEDSPGTGKIRTAWHQVAMASNPDDMVNPRTVAQNQGMGMTPGTASPAAASAGMPTRLAYKRYFIRFEVGVLGGRPWRVKVVGHAAEWEPGAAMPVELHGIARPAWLEGRTEALLASIYKRVQKYAIPMKDETKSDAEDEAPKTDPKKFGGIPDAAAKMLASLSDTLAKRDYAGLRVFLADDVTWSLGGGTGADAAIAMWQADAQAFDAMVAAITTGCAKDGETKVACPGGPPVAGKYQLVLEPRGAGWKVTSFVAGD